MGPRSSGSSRRRTPRPCLLHPLWHHTATFQPTRPTARPVLLTTPLLPCSATTLWALLAAAVTNPIAPLREAYCPRGHGAADELLHGGARAAIRLHGGRATARGAADGQRRTGPTDGRGAQLPGELRGEGLARVNGSRDTPSTARVSSLPLLASAAAAAEASAAPTVMSICYTRGGGEEEGRDEQEGALEDVVRAICHRAGRLLLQNLRERRGWRSPGCTVAAGDHGPKFVGHNGAG